MKSVRILSWNVNGIRAVAKKGALQPILDSSPDIVCLQETKAHPEQLPPDLSKWEGYYSYFSSAAKKGYSGVALFSKIEPLSLQYGFGEERFDTEGRIIIAEYKQFILFNIYYPNGQQSEDRLQYKYAFYAAFLKKADEMKKKNKNIIFCGDVNTAHKEIDLSRPKENSKSSGFLPEERAWLDRFVSHGYLDAFRLFNQEPGNYTWWDYKTAARERNIGWRIDYFFISQEMKKYLKAAGIRSDINGSDHCPVTLDLLF